MSRRPQPRRAPTLRSIPVTLPGATEYSDDPTLNGPLTMIGRIKGLGHHYTRLRHDVRIDHNWGPRRSPGDWALVMLEFTISGFVDIEPWYKQRVENTSFWKACGFREPPSKSLVYERLAELTSKAAEFEHLAHEFIRLAASKDPNVGAWLHIDGTEAETHAVARHDCGPGDDCPDLTLKRLERLDTPGARKLRHQQATEPSESIADAATATGSLDDDIDEPASDSRGGVRFKSGAHWWYRRDATAGRRAYRRDGKIIRVWDGHYLIVVIDHYTGGMLSARIQSASVQEVEGYEPSIEGVQQALGRTPLAVAADRGFSLPRVFAFNTCRSIASVMPHRRRSAKAPLTPAATDRWDENGVPICQHCGGGTDHVTFFIDRDMPRLRYRCTLPQTPDCHKNHTINCKADYTRLLPLWETHEAHAILREAHPEYERIHHHNRRRYRIGADCLELRPKRIGAAWQQLRASAAVAIEWLRICLRQGWLGNNGRQQEPRPRASKRVLEQTLEARRKHGRWAAASPTADPVPAPHRPAGSRHPPPSQARSPGRVLLPCPRAHY